LVTDGIRYEDYHKLLLHLARRCHRRLFAAGAASVQLEDIVSEMGIAFCVARDRWKPEFEVPFGAYLTNGISHHINRWAQGQINQSQMAPYTLDAADSSDEEGLADSDALSFDIASQQPDAEQMLIEKKARERAYRRMSPMTAKFVELLDSPPPELYRELEALRQRSEYARSRGVNSTFAKNIGAPLIFDFMGCNRVDRVKIYQELKRLAAKVSHP